MDEGFFDGPQRCEIRCHILSSFFLQTIRRSSSTQLLWVPYYFMPLIYNINSVPQTTRFHLHQKRYFSISIMKRAKVFIEVYSLSRECGAKLCFMGVKIGKIEGKVCSQSPRRIYTFTFVKRLNTAENGALFEHWDPKSIISKAFQPSAFLHLMMLVAAAAAAALMSWRQAARDRDRKRDSIPNLVHRVCTLHADM